MRKKGTEAKSIGFYVIIISDIVVSLLISLLIGFNILSISNLDTLVGALLGVEGALLGFMITIFALYFTYDMPEELKKGLERHGFYTQVPRDMIRCIVVFAVSMIISISSFFIQGLAQSIIVGLAITQFLCGLALLIFVTMRFFMIVRKKP